MKIRDLRKTDAEIITREEIAQGWNQTIDKYLTRLMHQENGLCISLVAEYEGEVAGYISVYPRSIEGPYGNHRCEPYKTYCNDDDLQIFMEKRLSDLS